MRSRSEPRRSATNHKSEEVKIRAYRQGLGDCFLVSLPGRDRTFHVLIDCGVLLGTPDATEIMRNVAADIHTVTGGTIDLLIATHEHWDHLSGFVQAEEDFRKMQIRNLWLAWTEDPDNKLANKLKRERKRRRQALELARIKLAADSTLRAHIDDLLGFFGAALGSKDKDTAYALSFLKECCKPMFCYPSRAPLAFEELPGTRFYILGPPEDEVLLRKSDPTKTGKEVYEFALNPEAAFYAALGVQTDAADLNDRDIADASLPFDKCLQIPRAEGERYEFFKDNYCRKEDDWRRIDADWLNASEALALKLDGDTNNTSLAVAIELADDSVFLFAADAQVGNWLSWDQCSWKVQEDGTKRTVTAEDLLRRTVLYKVGHHGSHNATLRDQGLERMTSDDLIAIIPVNKDMVRKKKWNMPFLALLKRLNEKTNGRALQLDDLPKRPTKIWGNQLQVSELFVKLTWSINKT